jgi:hypothetical protein
LRRPPIFNEQVYEVGRIYFLIAMQIKPLLFTDIITDNRNLIRLQCPT